MNLIADESVEAQIVDQPRGDGHDVVSIQEQSSGKDDDWILSVAARDRRLLLTADKDFGELVFRLGRITAGVILIRLAGLSNKSKASTVLEAIRAYADDLLGSFSVIEPGHIRIRQS